MPESPLDTLRAVGQRATAKPWNWPDGWEEEDGLRFIPILGGGVPGSAEEHCVLTVQSYGQPEEDCEADAEWTITARNHWDALLDVVANALDVQRWYDTKPIHDDHPSDAYAEMVTFDGLFTALSALTPKEDDK